MFKNRYNSKINECLKLNVVTTICENDWNVMYRKTTCKFEMILLFDFLMTFRHRRQRMIGIISFPFLGIGRLILLIFMSKKQEVKKKSDIPQQNFRQYLENRLEDSSK